VITGGGRSIRRIEAASGKQAPQIDIDMDKTECDSFVDKMSPYMIAPRGRDQLRCSA